MKSLLVILAVVPLSILDLTVFPDLDLIVWIFVCVILDFFTGVLKSIVTKKARTSEGFRKTIVKFTQYGIGALVAIILANAVDKEHTFAKSAADFFSKGIYWFIIYIECTSILENAYVVDKKSVFSKYIIKPLLAFMTFQLEKLPLILKGEEGNLLQKEETKE